MNKKKIDTYLKDAVNVIEITGIAQNGSIKKSYRGQISTFGASVTMGSILSAVACFSEQGQADVNRSRLMAAIYILLKKPKDSKKERTIPFNDIECKEYANLLFEYVKEVYPNHAVNVKEEIMECAVALKLAMNLYKLEK